MPRAPLLAVACAVATACAASTTPRGRMPVRSIAERRQERVVRQGWDLSCGAAALGTILTYHLGDRVGEAEIVAAILRDADTERIRERGGFSLLDLKRFAVGRGHEVRGYKSLRLESLLAFAPAIVPTLGIGGPHFVVFHGVERGRAVVSDPAFGNRTVPLASFERAWTPRIAFVVRRPGDGGDGVGARPRPPIATGQALRSALRATR